MSSNRLHLGYRKIEVELALGIFDAMNRKSSHPVGRQTCQPTREKPIRSESRLFEGAHAIASRL